MTATAAAMGPATARSWRRVLTVGLIGAGLVFYLCAIGIVPTFGARGLIKGVVTLGQISLVLTWLTVGWIAATRAPQGAGGAIGAGLVAGFISGVVLTLVMILNEFVPLRSVLPNLSPDLFKVLTFDSKPPVSGAWIPAVIATVLGGIGAALTLLPRTLRRVLVVDFLALVTVGLFSELLRTPMISGPLAGVGRTLFASEGLTLVGAIVTLIVATILALLWDRGTVRTRVRAMPQEQRKRATVPIVILLVFLTLWLPLGLGSFVSQAIALIALYILMGLGLNITLGLAGLLDLGFVAFFAVGGYTVALLTSNTGMGIAHWPFWAAVPVGVLVAMAFGVFLGLPILGIRGDYLAIATLGFGFIVETLARSDLLLPILGGPQGITSIPKPIDGLNPKDFLAGPNQIYYIALACAAVIAFVAYRLRGSRLGRAWIAIREDEDVAEALGVNLVQTKTLAYMLGAAFAGLGGAIFASLVGAMFPSSINFMVSINVVAIVVVGGMGSIPGVIVGAIFLIGLPELFREFSEYRFLFYGIALIVVMRYRPEGLLPTRIGRAELMQPPDPLIAASLESDEELVREDQAILQQDLPAEGAA
ncbi:MAG: branched-chain amino acid ABC transporter permease [Chloroflexota bacterium]